MALVSFGEDATLIFRPGQETHLGIFTLVYTSVPEYRNWPLAVEDDVKRGREDTSTVKYAYWEAILGMPEQDTLLKVGGLWVWALRRRINRH